MSDYILPSDPAIRTKLKNSIREASDSLTRIEAERDLIKNIKSNMKEEYGIPPKVFGQILQAYHKNNMEEREREFEELTDIYSVLFNKD